MIFFGLHLDPLFYGAVGFAAGWITSAVRRWKRGGE